MYEASISVFVFMELFFTSLSFSFSFFREKVGERDRVAETSTTGGGTVAPSGESRLGGANISLGIDLLRSSFLFHKKSYPIRNGRKMVGNFAVSLTI